MYVYANQGLTVDDLCPFCRTPAPSVPEDIIKRNDKRMEAKDSEAFYNLGVAYSNGVFDIPINHTKALELFHRAGELGSSMAYRSIGSAYYEGNGVERNMKKAKHYWELAAMRGEVRARYNLGVSEEKAGNMDRALKHWMIAVRSAHTNSLKQIKALFEIGLVTKSCYEIALRSHQTAVAEIRSDQRDQAAASSQLCRYY